MRSSFSFMNVRVRSPFGRLDYDMSNRASGTRREGMVIVLTMFTVYKTYRGGVLLQSILLTT